MLYYLSSVWEYRENCYKHVLSDDFDNECSLVLNLFKQARIDVDESDH